MIRKAGQCLPVDVLLRADRLGNLTLAIRANVFTERELHEHAGYSVIRVKVLNDLGDLGSCGHGWESDMAESNADFLGGLGLHANIDRAVWARTGLDDRELGREPRELCPLGGDARSNIIADRPEGVSGVSNRQICDHKLGNGGAVYDLRL
jgi:hypothetical protein